MTAALNKISEADVEKLLTAGAVMITVNRRLSRYLTRRYNQRQIDAEKTVWETPDILPYDAWLGRIYDNTRHLFDKVMSGPLKIRLSPAQERYVWEQVIQSSESGNVLLRPAETAGVAGKAWEICRQWHLPVNELSRAPTEDTAVFLAWADAFEKKCRDNNWLDTAGLGDAVMQLLKAGHIAAPGQIILAGFDELSPQQVSLVKVLQDLGCQVSSLVEPDIASQVRRCEPADTETEIRAAAGWARSVLEKNPSARIGIIVYEINALRSALVRIFDDVLHPSAVLLPRTSGNRAYNISLGRSLADYPAIGTALMILNFAFRSIFTNEYGRLIRSPFVGGADAELSKRAMLDARIRENGETALTIFDMIYFSKAHEDKDRHPGVFCPKLSKHLDDFKNAINGLPAKQLPSDWVRDFSRLLDSMGWGHGRELSSEEFQAVNAWREALHQFAAFDSVCAMMDMKAAVAQLTRMIQAITFQPETDEVPIQIMGMLETAGERFDHMWIMGLDAESWPPAPQPNPFLPVGLQKKYNVPHASPEREFEYARGLTRRLLSSAEHVMVSSPLKDGDTILLPTPLISNLERVNVDLNRRNWCREILNAAEFDKITDQYGPAADAKSRISGGTGLLKAQAACPFSAFAAYRLQAKALEVPESGLNARERGSLIHNALEFFWEEILSLDVLKKLSDEAMGLEVSKAVDRAVSAMANKHPRTFTKRFTELEKERLIALMQEFLAVDLQRTPFTVVSREKKLVCMIAGIELQTYADRIDQLDDGRLVIVDYKTGEPKVADWFTDRIAEPQLPLYSVVMENEVAGVVFAQVKKGNVKYLGVAADAQVVPGVRGPGSKKSSMENFNSLEEVINFWKGKITFLASEVRQGIAKVAPVSVNTSCQYCDFGPMCRIGEIDFF